MSHDENKEEKGRSYVQQAREDQQQYTTALLRENEKLRASLAMIESDHRRSEEMHRAAITELERLRSRFEEVAEENSRFVEQSVQIEAQSSNLANLYVASYQLHSSVERKTVLNTILEIVINLVGSEEVGIYKRGQAGTFELAASFGLDEVRFSTFPLRNGELDHRISTAEITTNAALEGGQDGLTACIPLKVGDELIGAILVFRLLDHKPSLEPVDHELFELLAVHASTALYCAELHEATPQGIAG